jgi:hypothetical protein
MYQREGYHQCPHCGSSARKAGEEVAEKPTQKTEGSDRDQDARKDATPDRDRQEDALAAPPDKHHR